MKTWEEFYHASEPEQIAEMLGMAVEYSEEYESDPKNIDALRDIYKKYCLEHGIVPDNWYLGIYE